jgi:hypothetical protein
MRGVDQLEAAAQLASAARRARERAAGRAAGAPVWMRSAASVLSASSSDPGCATPAVDPRPIDKRQSSSTASGARRLTKV